MDVPTMDIIVFLWFKIIFRITSKMCQEEGSNIFEFYCNYISFLMVYQKKTKAQIIKPMKHCERVQNVEIKR